VADASCLHNNLSGAQQFLESSTVVLKRIGTHHIFSLMNRSGSLAISNLASIAKPGSTEAGVKHAYF
jgi:hypothetical protein